MSNTQREPSHGPDATISRTVEALMAYRDVSRAELCEATHMSRASYYNRMSGQHKWSAAEVADAAGWWA